MILWWVFICLFISLFICWCCLWVRFSFFIGLLCWGLCWFIMWLFFIGGGGRLLVVGVVMVKVGRVVVMNRVVSVLCMVFFFFGFGYLLDEFSLGRLRLSVVSFG